MIAWWFAPLALGAGVEPASWTVAGAGTQEIVVEVATFGRFAVAAASAQGTAVQLVDRMTGPGPVHGIAGEADGRVDAFLEAGQTKVVLHSAADGTGVATMAVRPFETVGPATAPRMVRTRLVHTELHDFERRSWWVQVDAAQIVALEAMGRWLGDLQLWRDGGWLVDAVPRCERWTPAEGQPQRRCQLVARLEPGLYLASAYGGPSEPWANASDTAPLSIRWDVPALAAAGRRVDAIGPMGFDRYRVPGGADTFHVVLPDHAPVRLEVADAATSPLANGGRFAEITDKSRRPEAMVVAPGRGDRTVTVSGPIGQKYTLTWFERMNNPQPIDASGEGVFVSTLHPSAIGDEVDPTGLWVQRTPGGRRRLVGAQGVPLSRRDRYERRFNLAEATSLLLDVTEKGSYGVRVEGVEAELALDPFLLDPPDGVQPTPLAAGELEVQLDPGLYVLRLVPRTPGIATVRIAHASQDHGDVLDVRPAVQIPALRGQDLQIWMVSPSRSPIGLIARTLPVDAGSGLALALLPGEALTVPLRFDGVTGLAGIAGDGAALPVLVDGVQASGTVAPGVHQITLTNPGSAPITATLQTVPIPPEAPLPAMSAEALRGLRDFPRLTEGAPVHLDLAARGSATYRLDVAQDGLYRVQSTGLLATTGEIRTRLHTGFAEATAEGAGRNFLVATYLRSGTYQVTVQAQGDSAGPLGLELVQASIAQGGTLADGVPARITLAPGEGVRYGFDLAEAGRVRVRSIGLGGTFRCRVIDADGWPVTTPDGPCDRELELPAGRYAVLGLPVEVEHRRVTTLELVRDPIPAPEGHGPFVLALGATGTHVWEEPADGAERHDDVWQVHLPASVTATVELSPEMAGELVRDGQVIARLVPGQPSGGPLDAGPLEIRVRGARRGTGVPYRLAVVAEELVVGTSRTVALPARVPVRVGAAGMVRMGSAGGIDVRGRLVQGHDRLVAANDDRPDDWNFQLTARLAAGDYTLVVDAVGRGTTTVWMEAPAERALPPLAPGAVRTVATAEGATSMALVLPPGRDVLVASASSAENVGIALEHRRGGAWAGLGTASGREPVLVARLPTGSPDVRLRVWSEDGRGGDLDVEVQALRARVAGVAVELGQKWGAVSVGSGGGLYDVAGARGGLFVCPEAGAACAPASAPVVGASDDGLVLVQRGGRVRVERIRLGSDADRTVRVGARPQAVDVAGRGPSLLVARASAGQPRVAFEGGVEAVGPGAAIALSIDGVEGGRVWDAGGAPVALDVGLSAVRLSEPELVTVAAGRQSLRIPARGVVALALPGAPHDLQLALEAGVVAFADTGASVWAEPRSVTAWLPAVAHRAWIANPTDSPALAIVDVVSAGTVASTVWQRRPVEWLSASDGVRVLRVPVESDDGVIRVRGADATYVAAEGGVEVGDGALVGAGGWLHLSHGAGPVFAWIEAGGVTGPSADVDPGDPEPLSAGDTVQLTGPAQRFALSHPAPAVAQLRVPCPAVAEIAVGDASWIEIVDAGASLDVWMPEGRADVALRALTGAALYGRLTLATTVPEPLTEGLGPEVLLPSGASRWFSFTVERPGPVGIGVRAEAERVLARVMDARGTAVAQGVVRQLHLEPGRWFLVLTQPTDRGPVRARPALVGLTPPSEGPPAEVVKRYLQAPE